MNRRTVSTALTLMLSATLGACSDQNTSASAADLSVAADSGVAADLTPAKPILSFFISSESGSGNLGGLAGADARCQRLAQAVGAGSKKWAAYLSVSAVGTQPAVNARDRIGQGPWYNAKQVKIADSVAALHSDAVNINKDTGLDETGKPTRGRADTPNEHDILTGSDANGMVSGTANCTNWTTEDTTGPVAMVGHFDRTGGGAAPTSWNAAHTTPNCSAAGLVQVGGAGHLYCFATN